MDAPLDLDTLLTWARFCAYMNASRRMAGAHGSRDPPKQQRADASLYVT